MSTIRVIIPAYNEERSIGLVLNEIPDFVEEVIVVNNNSSDRTSEIAKEAGATVLDEPIPGYGRACLKGVDYVYGLISTTDIVVFLDGDYSDNPKQMSYVVDPILSDGYDMVIGSRALGKREKGSMTIPQLFGNWLASRLLRFFYGTETTDLGPFRAIRADCLRELYMEDKTYGWTVEMQAKAAKYGFKVKEVPVDYKRRIGQSKISGTVKGVIMAAYKIIYTIFKYL